MKTGPEIESILDFGGKNLDFGFRFEIDLRALKFSILDFGTAKRGNRGRDVYISQVFDFECIKVFDFDFGTELSESDVWMAHMARQSQMGQRLGLERLGARTARTGRGGEIGDGCGERRRRQLWHYIAWGGRVTSRASFVTFAHKVSGYLYRGGGTQPKRLKSVEYIYSYLLCPDDIFHRILLVNQTENGCGV